MRAEAVLQGFELPGLQLEVNGFDPVTGTVTLKNNNLSKGTYAFFGYIFGEYDASTETFTVAAFQVDSVVYAWGIWGAWSVPDPGGSESWDLPTYALNVASETTFDVLAFIGTSDFPMQGYNADFGYGSREIGIKFDDLSTYFENYLYHATVYLDQLTVEPYTALPAEVTDFSIVRA